MCVLVLSGTARGPGKTTSLSESPFLLRHWVSRRHPSFMSPCCFSLCYKGPASCPKMLKPAMSAKGPHFIVSFICLFILGCAGSSLLLWLFSSCGQWGLFSHCGVQASHCIGFSCRAQALGCTGFHSHRTGPQ